MIKFFCFLFFAIVFSFSVSAADAEYAVNQKAYDALGAEQAYTLGFTGAGVTIAVVDNGTLSTHQELKDQFSDLQKDEYNIQDIVDHGTPVSSLIAGKKDGTGMHGIAYDAKIVAFAVELDDGVACTTCYQQYSDAWNILATDEFDNVKIINNSIGSYDSLASASPGADLMHAANALVAKNKLIVASAGNDTSLSPSNTPAGLPYYNSALKYNFISAIAYNPSYTPSSPYFLASYSNLAQGAQEWSLAAPVGSLTAASHEGDSAYTNSFAGTSAAAPVISGAAGVLLSAFPYMGGKQLADVLFSTADKNYASFSNYMVQKDNGKAQFLFFGSADGYGKDWTDAEKKAVVQAEMGGAYTCSSDGVVCADVSYTDVFGQGLINLANAVKGPGYFDANRLTSADFIDNQYVYTIDVQNYDSTWSNNIAQVKSKTENTNADVGLKKQGTGTLVLSGQNTYLGSTIIENGTLQLTGSLAGDVSVSSGIFYLNGGTVLGNTINLAGGQINVDGGTLSSLINSGTVNLSGGSVKTVDNRGIFYLDGNGLIAENLTNNSQFYLNNGNLSGTVLNNGQMYLNGGTVSSKIQNTGTVQNNTELKEGLVSGGTLVNQAGGSLYLTSTPDTLVNYGKIILSPSLEDPSVLQQMNVSYLTLAAGGFALDMNNLPEFGEGTSYLVLKAQNSFDVSDDFELSNQLSQFIVSHAVTDKTAKTVSISLEYLPLSSFSYAPNLTETERQTATVIDRLFKSEGKKDFSGYYFLNESNLKTQINKMHGQVTPVHFTSLPLSNKLGRTIQTHLFERQISKDPYQYEGRREYYTPSSSYDRSPRGDVYYNYRPASRVQEDYRHAAPRTNDVYRNYRPGNTPQENYRYYVPRNRDVYRNFRPSGRSGGQTFGKQRNVWGQILYSKGSYEADQASQRGDAESNSIGLMFGWDFVYSKDFLWGLTAGYAQSSVDQDNDTTDVTDLRFGAYFSQQKDFLSLDGVLMIGLQGYDKKRVTSLPLKTFEHSASFNGTSIEAALNVGYDLHQIPMRAGDWSFRPYIGATIIQMSQEAYQEKGTSDLNLSVQDTKDTSVILSPGIIAGFVAADANLFLFKPEYIFFDLRYDQYLTGGNPSTRAYFSADSLQTVFDSPDNEETSAFTIGIGINGRLSDKTRLNFLISERSGSKSSVQSISATLIHSF